MQTSSRKITVTLHARQNVTLLPRILQIFSRRRGVVLEVRTRNLAAGEVELGIVLDIDPVWHAQLSALLEKLVDVHSAKVQEQVSHG
ncbi:MAG TPA: hypothetical protein VK983_00085 [Candidatus Limnocylindrales bacterium]|nr:hypothetical protein [Candidatus Limnocylindrales bacterium]